MIVKSRPLTRCYDVHWDDGMDPFFRTHSLLSISNVHLNTFLSFHLTNDTLLLVIVIAVWQLMCSTKIGWRLWRSHIFVHRAPSISRGRMEFALCIRIGASISPFAHFKFTVNRLIISKRNTLQVAHTVTVLGARAQKHQQLNEQKEEEKSAHQRRDMENTRALSHPLQMANDEAAASQLTCDIHFNTEYYWNGDSNAKTKMKKSKYKTSLRSYGFNLWWIYISFIPRCLRRQCIALLLCYVHRSVNGITWVHRLYCKVQRIVITVQLLMQLMHFSSCCVHFVAFSHFVTSHFASMWCWRQVR